MADEVPRLPVVDRGAMSARPTDDDVRAWARDRRIFVSSVMSEFRDERMALSSAIEEQIGAESVLFERLGGRDEGAQRAYLEGVGRSDVCVGIVGDRYGTMTETGRSATHEEYREAIRLGKRISVWVAVDGSSRQGNTRDFVDEVRLFHTTGEFVDETGLIIGVLRRLREIAAQDLSPWVMLGDLAFRASRIEEDTDTITLQTSIRDADVEQALMELRGGRIGQQATVYSDHSKSYSVLVDEVTRSATSTATSELSLLLRKQPGSGAPSWMARVAIQGYTPDELVALGLRHSLFGEALPTDLTGFGGFGVPAFTLAGVESVDADAAASVARVMLVAQLVGGGHARAVKQVLYGGGQRAAPRLRVTWTSVDNGGLHEVEGVCEPADASAGGTSSGSG